MFGIQPQVITPSRILRKKSLDAYKKAYGSIGYKTCQDAKHEKGFEKIAIYAKINGEPTHAARQLNQSKWTSKLGKKEDIEHAINGLDSKDMALLLL